MKKVLSLFLAALMVITVFAVAMPFSFAAETLPPEMKAIVSQKEAFYPEKTEIEKVIFVNLQQAGLNVPEETWDVSADSDKPVKAWITGDGEEDKVLYIGGNGGVTLNAYSASMFEGFTALESVSFGKHVNTSKVKTMEKMFKNCTSLTTIDLANLDTSSVTNFSEMFMGCTSLEALDLEGLDIENATTIARMCRDCTSLKTVKINGWYFGENLTTMDDLFAGCGSLTDVYIYDVSFFHSSKPSQHTVYDGVPYGLVFHDNNNIGEDSLLWDRFFNDAAGAVLKFDYPEKYEIVTDPESTLEMLKGQTKTITATVLPRPVNKGITWTSLDKSIATVDENGVVTAHKVGKTTIVITTEKNIVVNSQGREVYKETTKEIIVDVKGPVEKDHYKITFVKPDNIEYFQVSNDGGATFIPVHGGEFEFVKDTTVIVKAYGNALTYIFYVNDVEIETEEDNYLVVEVNKDKTITVNAIDAPSGEETASFFEKIIQWFKDLFQKLFGWM